jgi:threonine dehydratase
VNRDLIWAASERTEGMLRTTPVIRVEAGGLSPVPVLVKLELMQHTGSFKPRGMYAAITALGQPGVPLVIASGGNAGLAVAHAGRRLSHPVSVFTPSTSPEIKRTKLRALGADVHVIDGIYDDAFEASQAFEATTGAARIHAFDDPQVVAGQGTIFNELDDQLDGDFDTVLVAVGGGGLIGGALAWFHDDATKVVSVEPESSQCLRAAVQAGAPTQVPVSGLAADSLGAKQVGAATWSLHHRLNDSVVVSDDAIAETQRAIYDQLHLVAEPGGAAALAALRIGAYQPQADERVAVLICGGNCDPATVTG